MTGCKSFTLRCGNVLLRIVKVPLYLIKALLMIIFWPFWMLLVRFRSARKFAVAPPQTRFDMKQQRNEDLIASSRAQILEAAIESSFQPILQLYLLLPMLITPIICPGPTFLKLFSLQELLCDREDCTARKQFWSVVTSIVSLSWSFTFYQAVQKKGALDVGSNLTARLVLFLSNLLQITSRLFALILYSYSLGAGNFWIMLAGVLVHLLLMTCLHHRTSDEWQTKTFKGKMIKIVYHCLINGICNLYFHNWINSIKTTSTKEKRKNVVKEYGTILRQCLFDSIFVSENLAILTFSVYKFNKESNGTQVVLGLAVFILCSQYLGILLKIMYYCKFHIWKHTFTFPKALQNFRKSLKILIGSSKREKDETENSMLPSQKEVDNAHV